MAKIKVLWIITGGLRRNGICVSQLEYAKRINKKRFVLDVAAVHNNSSEIIAEYETAGCRVIVLPDRREKTIKYKRALKEIIKTEKYDVVHTFGSSSLMGIELSIAKKCGVKLRIAHSRNTTCDRKLLEKILRIKFNRTYNFALSCGKEAGDWLFDDKKYIILHNGKDLNRYSFNEKTRNLIRKKYNIENKLAFAHVGNFNNQKNHNFLIDIFNELHKKNKDTVLFLMGSGEKEIEIKNKVSKLGLNDSVYFLGSINNVEDVIQGMDIMLLPSLYEGLPNVVIEWQASGLPCVLSNKITKECKVSDLVYFVAIDKGIEEWLKCIEKIDISKYNRIEESINSCKKLIENGFDINSNTKKLEELYKKNI